MGLSSGVGHYLTFLCIKPHTQVSHHFSRESKSLCRATLSALESIAAKSSSTLGLLKRNLSKCPQKLRERAYILLIKSRLEYCAAVWDPYLIKDINTLEGIQRRAARFVIQDHSRFTSVSSLLKDLNWAPLKDCRQDI